MANEYLVYLGVRDWRHAEWIGHFYPEDMPEDWRLSFYATQFSCVWLDAVQWRGVASETLQDWQADLPAGFRMLLEPDAMRPRSALPDACKPDCCGWLAADDPRLVWFVTGTDMRLLSARIEQARTDPPLYLISQDHDLGKVEQVRTLLELLGL